MRIVKSLVLTVAVLFVLIGTANADTMVLSFSMYIDHEDSLIIDGNSNTLQWYYHGRYAPVGLWPDYNVTTQKPTHVIITKNGTTLLDTQWNQWTTVPSGAAYSSTLPIPAIPETYTSLSQTLAGRDSITLDTSGYPYMKIHCYDGSGNADWYSAKITINYTPAPVPVPAALLLFAPGLAGILAMRKKMHR